LIRLPGSLGWLQTPRREERSAHGFALKSSADEGD
jgi:hypothetical protein